MIHATVTPSDVSRRTSAPSDMRVPAGAKSLRATMTGPRMPAGERDSGVSISMNPSDDSPRIALVATPSTASQRSRMRHSPARSSQIGRAP